MTRPEPEQAHPHALRRRDRSVDEARAREILGRAEHGVLATVGADGWPYAVAVNHVLAGELLYFHGARTGHKLDNIGHDQRVCYTAVASAEVVPKELTTRYESATVFGRASLVEDPGERQRAFELLGQRFSAAFPAELAEEIRKDGPRTAVVRIRIERLTGKANR